MKKHVLHELGDEKKIGQNHEFYYDDESQISYVDSSKKVKVISLKQNTSTIETRVVEVSDPDVFDLMKRTRLTETGGELSDADEILLMAGSRYTYTKETSDPDEFLI